MRQAEVVVLRRMSFLFVQPAVHRPPILTSGWLEEPLRIFSKKVIGLCVDEPTITDSIVSSYVLNVYFLVSGSEAQR